MDDEQVVGVELDDEVLALALDTGDLGAFQPGDAHLLARVPADRPGPGDLDGLDPLAHYLSLQVAPDRFDLGQLRHRCSRFLPGSWGSFRSRSLLRRSLARFP